MSEASDFALPCEGWLCVKCGKVELYEFASSHWQPGTMRVDRCDRSPVPVTLIERDIGHWEDGEWVAPFAVPLAREPVLASGAKHGLRELREWLGGGRR